MNHDTVKLLRECNAGIKMGTDAFKKVLPRVKSKELKDNIKDANKRHCELGDIAHGMLSDLGADTKPPHAIASIMSDAKITLQLMMNESDKQVASLMTDGCNMGIKSLSHYLNKYDKASLESKRLAKELIDSEDVLSENLRRFL